VVGGVLPAAGTVPVVGMDPVVPALVLTWPLAPLVPAPPPVVAAPVDGDDPGTWGHPTTAWPWSLTRAAFDTTGPAEAMNKPTRPAPTAPSAVRDARLRRLCMR